MQNYRQKTKHQSYRNKIHWGMFFIFSFFISTLLLNPKEAKADFALPPWVPANSPLANKEHPRLFFAAKDLSVLRDKLKTQYKTELQDFINFLDFGFNDVVTTKNKSDRSYDAMNYAFLYLIDPNQMTPTFAFGHTRDEYGKKAIEHSLTIADDILAGTIVEDSYETETVSTPVSMTMALVYDWVHPLFVPQEIQKSRKLADAFIKIYQIRKKQPGVQLSEGTMGKSYSGPVGGLAIWGDNLDDSSTGTYYADNFQQFLDLTKTDWMDVIYANLNYFYDKSGWRESWSYDEKAWSHVVFFTGMFSTAIGQDYFYNTPYLRYHPLFFLYSIRPYSNVNGNYLTRYGTMSDTGSTQRFSFSKTLYGAVGSLLSDPDMSGLAKWVIDQGYGSKISNSSLNIRYYYLFYNFVWGNKNVLPKSPSDLKLPIAQKFGSGQIIMKSGFTSLSDTLIQFWAPKFKILPGGHPGLDFAGFAIEKYGQLALDAGNEKGITLDGRAVPIFYATKKSMLKNTIGVYKPGEVDPKNNNLNFMGYSDGGDGVADNPTAPAYQDGGTNHIGDLKAWEPNTGDYTYVNYNYTRAWDSTKVSYANREFVYLNPAATSNKDFVVVFDRVTSTDPSYKKRWLLWSSFEPESNGTYTQDTTIPWKWESNNSNIVKITNNYGTHHGRLFSKTLLPNSFKINKTGGPGHEFTDAEYVNLPADRVYGQLTEAEAAWIGAWRTEVESTTNQKDDLFLHVLEIGDSNTLTSMTNTTRIDADNMTGTLIDDPTTPRIIMFTKNQTGDNISNTTYIANYPATKTGKHLLAGITPGTYDIYKNGTKIQTGLKSENGKNTLSFSSLGGSTFSIVQTGIAPPVYQCSDGLDNDNDTKVDYPQDPGCTSTTDNDETDIITPDTTPPVLSAGFPSGALPANTTQTTLSLTTNENSTCKYGTTPNTAYNSITNTFTTTGGLTHSQTITNLTNGTTYNYYIRCKDANNNSNTSDFIITFSVNTPQIKASDLNQDGKVDSTDFNTLKLDWGKTTKPKSDINQDGIVDTRDIGIMMGEWGG